MARTPAPGTRERILAVASRLFYTHGVQAVGLNRIITEARTGKNLLYRHFPTKADLVDAYLREAERIRGGPAGAARAAAAPDPRAQLVALVGEVATRAGLPGLRGCAFRNYLGEFPPPARGEPAAGAEPDPADIARRYLRRSRGEVAELVTALGVADPELLVDQLWLLVDGLYMQGAYRGHLDEPRVPSRDVAVALAEALIERATAAARG